jgi:hypothetical protein
MMRGAVLRLGSIGCQPVAFAGLAERIFIQHRSCEQCLGAVRGNLPRTTGWQPALPRTKTAR